MLWKEKQIISRESCKRGRILPDPNSRFVPPPPGQLQAALIISALHCGSLCTVFYHLLLQGLLWLSQGLNQLLAASLCVLSQDQAGLGHPPLAPSKSFPSHLLNHGAPLRHSILNQNKSEPLSRPFWKEFLINVCSHAGDVCCMKTADI